MASTVDRPASVHTSTTRSAPHGSAPRGKGLRIGLVALELFVALGALYGGWTLLHGAWGLSVSMLDRTPFIDWTWPGVLLLVLVALPMLVAAVAELARTSWAGRASLLAGFVLMAWIVGQVALIGLVFFLQPAMFVAGGGVALLAWSLHGAPARSSARRRVTSTR